MSFPWQKNEKSMTDGEIISYLYLLEGYRRLYIASIAYSRIHSEGVRRQLIEARDSG